MGLSGSQALDLGLSFAACLLLITIVLLSVQADILQAKNNGKRPELIQMQVQLQPNGKPRFLVANRFQGDFSQVLPFLKKACNKKVPAILSLQFPPQFLHAKARQLHRRLHSLPHVCHIQY